MLNLPLNHKSLLPVIVSLALFCSTPSYGQDQKKSDAPGTIAELKSAIEKILGHAGTPSVGLAIVNGDSSVWVAGLGKANIENNAFANENTMYRIGSTSKMFVSLAILKLQEEGRVSLKDKVRELVPDIEFENPWSETSPILVEHLLEHTTGWDDIHLTEYALNKPMLSLKEGLDFHPHSRVSRWVPGTRMAYCNSGPPVAAYIVEKITGQTFEDYIQEHFFQPMGMENMTYFASEQYKQLGATLYIKKDPQDYWNIIMRPSGSINASPKDMAKMLQFFINRGRVDSLQLISEESLHRMETPTSSTGAKAGLEYGYGLSNYSSPHKSFVYRSHNGGVNGGLTDFSYLPNHQVGYALMINSGNGSILHRISELIRNFQTSHLIPDSISREKIVQNPENDISGYYVPLNPRTQMFYFLERTTSVKRIWNKYGFTFSNNLLGGKTQTHVPISSSQCASLETGKINMVQVHDPIAGEVVHAGSQVLVKISPFLAIGQRILEVAWFLAQIIAVIFGILWSLSYWKGEISGGPNISVRLWPLIASLLFLALFVLVFIGVANPFELLGMVSFVSISIMILTVCFALASFWSMVTIIKERKAKIDKTLYWYSAVLSGLHLIVTCYLLWHGVIGIKTWA